jgi:hypothetical protein
MKHNLLGIFIQLWAWLRRDARAPCPYCGNQAAGNLKAYYSDENPANNQAASLLPCVHCHEKVCVEELATARAAQRQRELPARGSELVVAAVVLHEPTGNWQPYAGQPYAFFQVTPLLLAPPVLRLTLLNRSPLAVVLNAISGRAKHLYSGLSGLGPKPRVLRPLAFHHLALPVSGATYRLALPESVLLPAQQACMIELILTADVEADRTTPLTGRNAVYITFHFDDTQQADAPVLCFNCQHENEPLTLQLLT